MVLSVLLPSEGASFCKPCFSSRGLTEDSGAANTQHYCLRMAKDGGDFIASWALHVHEVGVGALHQALLLVFPLLLFWRGVQEVLGELREAQMQIETPRRRRKTAPRPHPGEGSPPAARRLRSWAAILSPLRSRPRRAPRPPPSVSREVRRGHEGPVRPEISVRTAGGRRGDSCAETWPEELTGMFS